MVVGYYVLAGGGSGGGKRGRWGCISACLSPKPTTYYMHVIVRNRLVGKIKMGKGIDTTIGEGGGGGQSG